jgi:stage V sporulation protein G
MSNVKLDVRVYPINEPQGNTKAFANVGIEDLVAINGIRVVSGEKGLFVTMPQSKDKDGNYHDIAFPINSELRKDINKAVLDAYKEIAAEKKQSIGDRLNEGAEKAAQHTQNKSAERSASAAKKSPGLGD